MSRKDFELIAATILRLDVDEATRQKVAEDFAWALKSAMNSAFDRERFVKAATVGKKTVAK